MLWVPILIEGAILFYSYKEAQKKMKAKYLFLVALLPLVANAWEPTPGYEKVSEGIDGTEYFLHKPSIKRKGDLVYFWVVEATPKGPSETWWIFLIISAGFSQSSVTIL